MIELILKDVSRKSARDAYMTASKGCKDIENTHIYHEYRYFHVG